MSSSDLPVFGPQLYHWDYRYMTMCTVLRMWTQILGLVFVFPDLSHLPSDWWISFKCSFCIKRDRRKNWNLILQRKIDLEVMIKRLNDYPTYTTKFNLSKCPFIFLLYIPVLRQNGNCRTKDVIKHKHWKARMAQAVGWQSCHDNCHSRF